MKVSHVVLALACACGALTSGAQTTTTNTPPTISGTPATSAVAGSRYSFVPTARDANGDYLRFYIANKPAWASFSMATGALSGTPTTANAGTYPNILIYVSDSKVSTFLPAFTLTVTSGGSGSGTTTQQAPVISGSPPTRATTGSSYFFQPTASDANGDYLRFYIANKPAWASFSMTTGALTGTPTSAHVGTYSNISIYVSDSKISTFLPPFSISVGGTTSANRPPVISGSPQTRVTAGTAYSFQPTASDADGDALTFAVTGKPSWATFNITRGSLTGTPTAAQAGTYSNIVIAASDGRSSTSLPAFAITVSTASTTGTASLSWIAPTQNTDGSALTSVQGYKVYHGTSATALNDVRTLTGTTTSYQFTGLASGTHYFAVSALGASGLEGIRSAVASKAIP